MVALQRQQERKGSNDYGVEGAAATRKKRARKFSCFLPIFVSDFVSCKYFPIHMFNNSTFLVIVIGYMLMCSLRCFVGFSQFFITKNILLWYRDSLFS